MNIILGSQSKSRRTVLEEAGIPFVAMSPNIDEKKIRDPDPITLTLAIANAKADALIRQIAEPSLLITSDQVVAWNGTIIEKPQTSEEARAFLHGYAQSPAETVSAVVVTNTSSGKRVSGHDIARVWFKEIDKETIETLLEDPITYTYAGGFSVRDARLKNFIIKMEGTSDSFLGLPMKLTKRLLDEAQEATSS